ncbi:hypothetical protein SPHINGOR109_50477 [Sphingorhabdus sp. 109]|nr:hypothetical protein SPHINGOR109_50477 [Sphingorhabdus sp. 109]
MSIGRRIGLQLLRKRTLRLAEREPPTKNGGTLQHRRIPAFQIPGAKLLRTGWIGFLA